MKMNSPFTIDIEKLRDGEKKIDFEVDPVELDLSDENFRFAGPVRGELKLQLAGRDVIVLNPEQLDGLTFRGEPMKRRALIRLGAGRGEIVIH